MGREEGRGGLIYKESGERKSVGQRKCMWLRRSPSWYNWLYSLRSIAFGGITVANPILLILWCPLDPEKLENKTTTRVSDWLSGRTFQLSKFLVSISKATLKLVSIIG